MSDPTPSSDGPQPGQIGPCQTWNHQSKGRIHGVEVRGDETWMHVRLVGDHRMRWLSPGRARSGEVTPDGEVVTLRRSFMTLVPDDVPVPPAPSSDTPSGEREILTPRQQAIEAILIRHQDHAFSFVARRIDALFTAPTPVPEASGRAAVDVTALPEWAALRELVADEMAAAPGHDHIAAMDAIADAAEALFAAADRGDRE